MTTSKDTSKDVAQQEVLPTTDQLRDIRDMDEALALLQEQMGVEVVDASAVIGDGFTMLEDKDRLVKEPFIAVAWVFADGDYADENGQVQKFVVLRAVTARGDKYIITDGSPTGICGQLRDYSARTGLHTGLLVKGGLRRSAYETTVNGKPVNGVTHYLNV